MFTKTVISFIAVALIGSSIAQKCPNPEVKAVSFTSLDATVLTQIAYITEFTLTCGSTQPSNYPLYAEVDGKALTAALIEGEENKYQVSWTEEPNKARSGVHEVRIFDEESWATLKYTRRTAPDATVAPLLAIQLQHPGSYSGPWVNSEVLATVLSIVVAYVALRNKSKILA